MTAFPSFPHECWRLLPSFKPTRALVVGPTSHGDRGWCELDNGKFIRNDDLYPTEIAAIEAGFKLLSNEQAALDKKQAGIRKRHETLLKAAGNRPE